MVGLRKLDRARIHLHVAYTPDGGSHYYLRTLELGECSTHYDAYLLERDDVFRLHPTFKYNPIVETNHPMVLLHATARDHFHALVVAALQVSDCCHKDSVLLNRVLNSMSAQHNTIDIYIGMLADGLLLENAAISRFPISAAIAACVLSDEKVEQMVTSSDDCFLSGLENGKKHHWQGGSVQYNRVTTYSNISEPGGHSPDGRFFHFR